MSDDESWFNFTGLRKQDDEIIEYNLRLKRQHVACFYKDRYGYHVATTQGRLYRLKNSIYQEVEEYKWGTDGHK